MDDQAIAQLKRICLNAWEKIETDGQTPKSFPKILQGPTESYTEFVARLQDAIRKQVTNLQAAEIIQQILAFDNANDDCKKAIGPMKGKTDLSGYIRLCQGVRTEQCKAVMLAQAMAGIEIGQNKFPGSCYNCGKSDHTRNGELEFNGDRISV